MIECKVTPGFATLNVKTQIAGFSTTHIALTAYVSGPALCSPLAPEKPEYVEIVVQSKTVWVEAECLTAGDKPEEPFEFIIQRDKAAA